jgi:hypothetical protein
MRLITAAGIAILLSAALVPAQQEKPLVQGGEAAAKSSTAPDRHVKVIVLHAVEPACPVSMSAKQGAGGGLLAARHLPDTGQANSVPSGPSQLIHLILSSAKNGQVVAARLKVLGLSGKARTENAEFGDEITPDVTRWLDVTFVPEGNNSVAANIMLHGMTSVRSIELQSISYKDGSTWRVAGQMTCSVAPDRMMLVAGR